MQATRQLLRFIASICLLGALSAQAEPLAKKGALLLSNNFEGSLARQVAVDIKGGWQRRISYGDWSPQPDGSLKAVYVPEHGHGPVMTFLAPIRDLIIECEFMLPKNKDKDVHFRIFLDHADYKGHTIQATANVSSTFRPAGLTLQHLRKNEEGKTEEDVEFGLKELDLKPGIWHKMRLELVGDQAQTTVNGMILSGQNKALDIEKAKIGLNPGMAGGSIRNFNVWAVASN